MTEQSDLEEKWHRLAKIDDRIDALVAERQAATRTLEKLRVRIDAIIAELAALSKELDGMADDNPKPH